MNRKRLINLMTSFICISAFLNAQFGVLANVNSSYEPANKLNVTIDVPQKLVQDDDGGGFDGGGFDGGGFDGGDFDSGGFDSGGADEGPAMDPGGGDDGPPDMGSAGDDGPPDMGSAGDDGPSDFDPSPGDMNPDTPDLAGPDQPDTPDDKAIDDAMKDLDNDTGTANADDKAIDDAMKDLDKDTGTANADDKAINDAMKDLDKDIDKSLSDTTYFDDTSIYDKTTSFTDTTNFINNFDRFGSIFTPGYIYGALPWISFASSLVFSALTPAILTTRFGPTARVVNSVPVTPQLAKQYGPQSKVVVVEYHDNYKPDVRVVEMKDKTGKLRGYQAIALQGDKYKVLKRYSANAKVRKNYTTDKQLASFDVIDSTYVIDKK